MANASARISNAAKNGDFEEVKGLIRTGNPYPKEHLFDCALQDFRTIKRNAGHLKILKFLYDLGLTTASRVGWMDQPILCAAAMYGNLEIIHYILAKDVPKDVFNNAALGTIDFFRQSKNLVAIDQVIDKNGFNPLHYCASSAIGNKDSGRKKGLLAVAQVLTERGVDPCLLVRKNIDLSPVLLCSWFGGNEEILEVLIKRGITQQGIGNSCLEFAIEPHQRSGDPYYQVAEKFIRLGWDINFRPNSGDRTLLHGAANRGSLKPTKWLLGHGADVDSLDEKGKTPLHVAAERNTTTGVVEMLLKYGSDINRVDNFGKTPLFYAKRNGRTKVARYLEENGAKE